MSSVRVLKTLALGPGLTMEINMDTAEPEDSIDRYFVDTICDGSEGADTLHIPAHWHKHHAEHISVLEGRCQLVMDGKPAVLIAGDPPFFIPQRAVHSMDGFKGERLVLRERADPAGIYKAMFFNDLLSTGKLSGFWHLMRVFYDGDAYIALPLGVRLLDEVFMVVVGGTARLFVPAKPDRL